MAVTATDWNQFVQQSASGSFLQSWEWGEFQQAAGATVWRESQSAQGELSAVALIIKRPIAWGRCWLYIPYGPVFAQVPTVADWQRWQEQLQDLAEVEQAVFVRCEPRLPETVAETLRQAGWRRAERDVQPRHTVLLDLRLPEESLLAEMHQKTRYNIRLAQRKGVTVRFSTAPADIAIFLQLSAGVTQRTQFHYHPDSYYHRMGEVLGAAGVLEVAIAEYHGQPLAAHILVRSGDTVTYAHGASSMAHKEVMAPHALQWASITRARAQGAVWYDFFGVAPPGADANHPWRGITRFKEGFGGERRVYVGAHDLVVRDSLYVAFLVARRARRLWR